MMPESRNRPLLENGSLKRVSAATDTLVEIKEMLRIHTRLVVTDRQRIIDEMFEVVNYSFRPEL
jgi:L-lysine 2,3-aminomutase